jgi:hypothetical protein
MTKHFSASLDTVSKIITGLLAPIFTIFPVILFLALRTQKDQQYVPYFIGVTVVLWLVFAILIFMWVKGYSIQDNHLVIHRTWRDKLIPLQDLKSAESITKKEIGLLLHYMGNGGVCNESGKTNCDRIAQSKNYLH